MAKNNWVCLFKLKPTTSPAVDAEDEGLAVGAKLNTLANLGTNSALGFYSPFCHSLWKSGPRFGMVSLTTGA